jgi:hypothetical protein
MLAPAKSGVQATAVLRRLGARIDRRLHKGPGVASKAAAGRLGQFLKGGGQAQRPQEFTADRRLAAARDDLLDVASSSSLWMPRDFRGRPRFSRSICSDNRACAGLRLPRCETLQSAATCLEVIHRLSARSAGKYVILRARTRMSGSYGGLL